MRTVCRWMMVTASMLLCCEAGAQAGPRGSPRVPPVEQSPGGNGSQPRRGKVLPYRYLTNEGLELEIERARKEKGDWEFDLLDEFHERHAVDDVVLEYPPGALWIRHAQIRDFGQNALQPGSDLWWSKYRALDAFYHQYLSARASLFVFHHMEPPTLPWKTGPPLRMDKLTTASLESELYALYERNMINDGSYKESFSDGGLENGLLNEFRRRRPRDSDLTSGSLRDFYRRCIFEAMDERELVRELDYATSHSNEDASYWEFFLLHEFYRRHKDDAGRSASAKHVVDVKDLREFFKGHQEATGTGSKRTASRKASSSSSKGVAIAGGSVVVVAAGFAVLRWRRARSAATVT